MHRSKKGRESELDRGSQPLRKRSLKLPFVSLGDVLIERYEGVRKQVS